MDIEKSRNAEFAKCRKLLHFVYGHLDMETLLGNTFFLFFSRLSIFIPYSRFIINLLAGNHNVFSSSSLDYYFCILLVVIIIYSHVCVPWRAFFFYSIEKCGGGRKI